MSTPLSLVAMGLPSRSVTTPTASNEAGLPSLSVTSYGVVILGSDIVPIGVENTGVMLSPHVLLARGADAAKASAS